MAVDSKDTASFDSIFKTGETDIRAKVDVKPAPAPLPSAVTLPAPLAVPAVLPLPPAPAPRPPKLPPPLPSSVPPSVAAPTAAVTPPFPPADLDPVLPPPPRRPVDLDPVLPAVARPTVSLDPVLPPEKKTTAKTAANLDPPLAVAAAPTTKEDASAPALARLRGLPLSPLFAAAAFVVGVGIVFVLLEPGGGASRAQVARSEAARAALIPQARSDVEEAVAGVSRRLDPGLRLLVVRDPQAFIRVLPDGWLVFSDGLLERLQSDAQLAALVAHATAHHRAGDLNDDDDGNAGQVFTAAEEEEADRAAIASLERVGLRARALGDVQDVLKKTAWSAAHPHSGQALLGSEAGEENKAAWATTVLDVLHPPKPAPQPIVPLRIEN